MWHTFRLHRHPEGVCGGGCVQRAALPAHPDYTLLGFRVLSFRRVWRQGRPAAAARKKRHDLPSCDYVCAPAIRRGETAFRNLSKLRVRAQAKGFFLYVALCARGNRPLRPGNKAGSTPAATTCAHRALASAFLSRDPARGRRRRSAAPQNPGFFFRSWGGPHKLTFP